MPTVFVHYNTGLVIVAIEPGTLGGCPHIGTWVLVVCLSGFTGARGSVVDMDVFGGVSSTGDSKGIAEIMYSAGEFDDHPGDVFGDLTIRCTVGNFFGEVLKFVSCTLVTDFTSDMWVGVLFTTVVGGLACGSGAFFYMRLSK